MDFATLVLGAKTDGLKDGERALDSLARTGGRTEAAVTAATGRISNAFKALAISSAGILSAGFALSKLTGAIGRIDAMDEAAQSIDGTVNALRALQLATGEAVISSGDLMATMQVMNREFAKAQAEGGPAAEALKKIGLSASELIALDADARLAAIADAMNRMGLSAGQATAVLQDLGVRSKEMSVALLAGGDAIRQARADVASLGLELNQRSIDAVTRANDALGRMGLGAEALGNQIVVALSPAIEAMSGAFVRSLQDGGALRLMLDGVAAAVTVAANAFPYLVAATASLATAYTVSLIPALVSGVAWLGSIEGMFIAGAIASRAMNVAIALTPIGLIMAAGAGLYALVSASNNATSAAAIHERAQTKLAEALERVNVGGLEGIRIKKQIAEAEVREALAATVRAEAKLKEAEALAKQTEAGRAMQPVQLAAMNAEKALFGAKENLQTMVDGARALGVNLSFLPAYLDPISAAAKETAGSLAEQLGYTQNMRAIYDADLVTAQGILAAQQERAKVAALTLQYGSDSAQVAQAHHDAEMKVLEAQVAQLGVTGQVKDAIIQQANAAWQLENAMVGATDAAGRLRGVASLIAGALSPAVSAAWQLVRALGAAIASLGGVASGLARVAGLSGALNSANNLLGKGVSVVSGMFGGAAEKLKGYWQESKKAVAEGKSLAEVLAGKGGGVAGGAGKATEALTEAEEAAKKYADTMRGYVTDGIGKAVDWMVGGFKGGLRGLVDVFKSTIQQMIAYAIKNKIMIGLGMGGSVAGSVASAAVGGGGAAGGLLGGILGKAGGVLSAFTGGISSVWAGLSTGGIGGAFSAVGTALGGATSGLAGLAGAAGALVLPLGIVAGLFSFFKKKTELLDSGLKVTVNGMDALVQTFATVKTTRFWGLSKKTNTTVEDASKEISDPITAAFKNIRKTVIGLAGDLGLGADRIKNFSMALSVSTKGMTQEEAQAAVVKELAKLGDGLAKSMLGGFNKLAMAGEGALDTLTRLSGNLTAANDAMKALGWSAFKVNVAGAGAASAMVKLFGGLDQFKAATDFYFQNFYTLAERAKYTGKQFRDALGDLGIKKVPKSIEQFRALMDRLREAGRDKAVAGLMQLAPLFMSLQELRGELNGVGDSATDTANRLQEREGLERRLLELQGKTGALRKLELLALDPANRALQKQIWTLEKLKAVADERTGLEKQLLQVQGNTNALRRLELLALDPTNRALQQQIWAAEKANEVGNQRADLERRLLELQGNTAELRNRELAALDPANRALQQLIWGLEDAKEAIDALEPEDFATLFDFNLAKARSRNGTYAAPMLITSGQSGIAAVAAQNTQAAQENAVTMNEIKQLLISISSNTRAEKDTLRKWDVDGLPPERV